MKKNAYRLPVAPHFLALIVLVLGVAGWSLWPVGSADARESAALADGQPNGQGVPMVRFVDDATPESTPRSAARPGPTVPPSRGSASPTIRLPGEVQTPTTGQPPAPPADEVLTPRGNDTSPALTTPTGLTDGSIDSASPPAGPASVQTDGDTAPPASPPAGAPAATAALLAAEPQTSPAEPAQPPAREPSAGAHPGVTAAVRKFESGQRLAARAELNRILAASKDEPVRDEARRQMARMNEDLFFSPRLESGDPLFDTYKLGSGEVLAKVSKRYDVPAEIIMRVNGVQDARRLRAGQALKMPRGPFHVKIDRSDFRLDLYLQDTYVRSFPVGLGKDRGTPLGTWKVTERLKDPTYFPPPNSPIKKIMPPGPDNPLGRFWIALEGVEGEAVGKEGFGIHGTNEPNTIGRAESLGCVRMHAADIEMLFGALQPGKSTVIIEP